MFEKIIVKLIIILTASNACVLKVGTKIAVVLLFIWKKSYLGVGKYAVATGSIAKCVYQVARWSEQHWTICENSPGEAPGC